MRLSCFLRISSRNRAIGSEGMNMSARQNTGPQDSNPTARSRGDAAAERRGVGGWRGRPAAHLPVADTERQWGGAAGREAEPRARGRHRTRGGSHSPGTSGPAAAQRTRRGHPTEGVSCAGGSAPEACEHTRGPQGPQSPCLAPQVPRSWKGFGRGRLGPRPGSSAGSLISVIPAGLFLSLRN